MRYRAVFFDMDGVLADSLPAHLQYCQRIARDLALDLAVPDAEDFKRSIVRAGVRISPMLHFFEAIGFSPADARRADERYRAEFSEVRVPLFPGVQQALEEIAGDLGLPMGLVTSNVRRNVHTTLSPVIHLFREECVSTHDDGSQRTKAQALELFCRELGRRAEECLFVGDQPADRQAALDADLPFLGTSYGWGFCAEDAFLETVASPAGIIEFLRAS